MKTTVVSLVVILGAAVVVTPLGGEAQQAGMVRRIGFLSAQSGPLPQHKALFDGLRDFGWIENHNIASSTAGPRNDSSACRSSRSSSCS